ncbi:hypothetical protein BC832DRAFT_590101 [Gaertneriomyces semiglobifer]|nr:hypothetical protein BC832DRAFT_590101 [Gaertneriomyces semiglobifer]
MSGRAAPNPDPRFRRAQFSNLHELHSRPHTQRKIAIVVAATRMLLVLIVIAILRTTAYWSWSWACRALSNKGGLGSTTVATITLAPLSQMDSNSSVHPTSLVAAYQDKIKFRPVKLTDKPDSTAMTSLSMSDGIPNNVLFHAVTETKLIVGNKFEKPT